MTFSFPLRTLGVSGNAAQPDYSPFLLRRFHGDDQNLLVRRWCDTRFMSDQDSPWPLVLYGASGTGKSALAETLACRLNRNCLFLTADDFRRQFHAAVATRSIESFRQRLRDGGMLVLDGFSVPSDESPLIREYVQLIDDYQKNRRPLIVTMIPSPWMMGPGLHALRSRLSEGLAIEIKQPGTAAKREIVADILKHFDLKMVDEDLEWLVRSLPDTAPLIRNFLSRIALETDDSVLTRETLKQPDDESSSVADPEAIQQLIRLVARQFGQRVSEITGKTRRKEVVRARSVALYLARDLLNVTFRQAGEMIGRRDPSTVRHACTRVRQGIDEDANLAGDVQQVVRKFQALRSGARDNLSTG